MRPIPCLIPFLLAGQTALADAVPPIDGEGLFQDLCADCHGEDATGGAPGDIRGLPRNTVLRALRGVEQMPEFDYLSEGEIAALLTWLGSAE